MKMYIVSGDKGGVGKSTVASVLLERRLAAGHADHVYLIEGDATNPDVLRRYKEHVAGVAINLRLRDGWMDLTDAVEDRLKAVPGTTEIVASLPAGASEALAEAAPSLVTNIEALGLDARLVWVINRQLDSLYLLRRHLELLPWVGGPVVALNGFFGSREKYFRWHRSKVKEEVLARPGGGEVFLPELHERVVDAVKGPYSMAAQGTEMRTSERTELQRWLREAGEAFKEI